MKPKQLLNANHIEIRDDMEFSVRRFIVSVKELSSAKRHAASFNTTRATYLRSRIIALCYTWSILCFVWIPVDLLFVDAPNGILFSLRLVLVASLLFVVRFLQSRNSLHACRMALGSIVISMNIFYLAANHVLGYPHSINSITYCYTLLPFVQVVMLTIFPLTIRESFNLMIVTALTQVYVDVQSGALLTLDTFALYWIQTVIGILVIWAQTSKLHMMMRLYRHATLDPLTGVYNRRMLLTLAKRDFENTRTKSRPYSVLLMDLDRFKRVNDRYGHSAGDLVLKGFTSAVQPALRKSDIFGRYGGEEFILFLPKCNAEHARQVAERIMENVRQLEINMEGLAQPIEITTSIGISTSVSKDDNFSSLLEKADLALYEAKNHGRDCSRDYEECEQRVDDNCRRPWLEFAN
ncbi:GGDEF domain-containing protein [Enterovibrio sp. ZSDZ35]|uniref:diguanylate cyclase n=1 Tax=Enterovibrio qingdaonensis TaxID=2899818 RepID=A0ABT5QRW1_9GAMM|nr:GGDEF domain-containing protein [Enterovibrio sp. ZSDZ35]MDD1783714.1 GGDEF domain-containing protein [Enterovibrio sp. ZSDZ35]